jgi:hypothetical protein
MTGVQPARHAKTYHVLLSATESEKILDQDSEAASSLSIPRIFGATDDDTDGLRIVSLYEVGIPFHFCAVCHLQLLICSVPYF